MLLHNGEGVVWMDRDWLEKDGYSCFENTPPFKILVHSKSIVFLYARYRARAILASMIDECGPTYILALRNSPDNSLSFLFSPLLGYFFLNKENSEMSLIWQLYSLGVKFKAMKSELNECPTTILLFKIFFNYSQIIKSISYNRSHFGVRRCMFEVNRFDSSNLMSIINDLRPWLD